MADPSEPQTLSELIPRLGEIWLTYVKGQLLVALIIGATIWVIGSAVGLSWAFMLGLVAGMLQTIPALGPLVAAVPAAVVALWKGSTVISVPNWAFALIVIGIYVVLQQISQYLIEPRLLGRRLDLPPLLVLVAVLLGAAIAGVPGAYLAAPVLASLREIGRFARRRASAGRPSH